MNATESVEVEELRELTDAEQNEVSRALKDAYEKYRRDRHDPRLGEYGAWLASVRSMFAFMSDFWDRKGESDG